MTKIAIVSIVLLIVSIVTLGEAPYQLDAGVRARVSGDPLFGQCDLRQSGEFMRTLTENKFYYSTDGQASWADVAATSVGGDRWTAVTGAIPGDAYWRFYFLTDSAGAGQTPVYSGGSTCRLAPNWYVYSEDDVGLDDARYGAGDWLDIRGCGFCISDGKIYGKIVKGNDDWRLTDGSEWALLGLYEENYGYMFGVNNPLQDDTISYAITWCRPGGPIDAFGYYAEFDQAILKVAGSRITVIGPAEFVHVAETMFVSCNISDLTSDPDFGSWPNDERYLRFTAVTMHVHIAGFLIPTEFDQYFPDEMRTFNAYYNNPIAPWLSSPTAPNTLPVLSSPTAVYDTMLDQTTVEVEYTDTDENPPEYVQLEIVSSRDIYNLEKAEIEGPYGWIDGVTYSGIIPGYHGFGAEFTFEACDGADVFGLPAGALYVKNKDLPDKREIIEIYPNPFNSSCRIYAPENSKVEVYDLNGRLVSDNLTRHADCFQWEPVGAVHSGVYMIRVSAGKKVFSEKALFVK